MKLHKYIILNIISIISIIGAANLLLSAYNIIPEAFSEIIYTFTKFGIVVILCVATGIEFHIRHEHPQLLPNLSFRNNILYKFHIFIFYTGFLIFCLKIVLLCIFPFLIFVI